MNILEMPLEEIMSGFGMPSSLGNNDELNAIDRLNHSNTKINTVVTAFVEAIFQTDNYGDFIMLKEKGYLRKGVLCLLSNRYPHLTRDEKKRLRERIEKFKNKGKPSLVRYDRRTKTWVVNLCVYQNIDRARLWAERIQFPIIQHQF